MRRLQRSNDYHMWTLLTWASKRNTPINNTQHPSKHPYHFRKCTNVVWVIQNVCTLLLHHNTFNHKTASQYLQLSLNKLLGTQLFMVWNKQMHPRSGMGRKKTAASNSSRQEISESYGQMTFDRSNTQTHIHSGIIWWLVLSGSDVYLVAVLTDRPRRDLNPQNPTKKAVFYNIGPCLNLFHRFASKISKKMHKKYLHTANSSVLNSQC